MNLHEAQQELAEFIKNTASKVKAYYWRLSGDAPNSLCKFLGLSEGELKVILRLCKIYNSANNDSFSKNNFDLLMLKCSPHLDWVSYKVNMKTERFIKIGSGGEGLRPKDFYGSNGSLALYPVEDEHIPTLRTKSQRSVLMKLLAAGSATTTYKRSPDINKMDTSASPRKTVSPKGLLMEYIQELLVAAAEAGPSVNGKISARASRTLHRLITSCVDVAAKELLHAMIEKYAIEQQENVICEEGKQGEVSLLPDPVVSSRLLTDEVVVVAPVALAFDDAVGDSMPGMTEILAGDPPIADDIIDVDDDDIIDVDDGGVGEDDDSVRSTTTIEFLSELKEEIVLQSLLHKRIHDKKQRVFHLEHRNGRRLLVVLPPDTQSVSSFEEEARKTNWVGRMLNTDERLEGMLTHLSKTNPKMYERVGRNRKLSMRTVVLTTPQTIALARVGRLNDTRMKKIRSFLRQVGQVNLQMSLKEQERIDIEVGLHRTKQAVFGSYIHEWSLTKGKEKKPPEQVFYWNSKLSREIEVEVDLHLQHLFLLDKQNEQYKDEDSFPKLDYVGDGFSNPGVTVLFGGDHGDKHCPISCKINLSAPTIRKAKKSLSYQCPIVVFGSVECTTDAYDLMNSTVMPAVKEQLKELKKSAMVTVYHRLNITKCFRTYTVPSTIHPGTVAFIPRTNDEGGGRMVATMTFAYDGNDGEGGTFGSVNLEDPIFVGVPVYELGAKVTISEFNELFIGDLAFLAMLIGMNHSSGSHCLLCKLKGSEFNCEHSLLALRTKETLVECLEEYMLLSSRPNRRAPPNVMGVNGPGLWDIDPQRIIIPILHCPMGLVDKVLESYKQWVNLDVEDFKDVETKGTRAIYRAATQRHQSAIVDHKNAQELFKANPTSPIAKAMEGEANKARIKAKQAESKAKEQYEDQVQRHNAKKSSLNQQFESVFRQNGVKREHYHGGKFNGVNCIRIMDKCKDLFLGNNGTPGFLQKCLLSKCDTIPEVMVELKCKEYCRLLGLLDAIWSTVRGLHSGLLPDDNQTQSLADALEEAKALWLQMGLSTLQPKWHLTFDGHLLDQFKKYKGLADKSDETIEKGHQTLKALRNRFNGISSYEQRETCIRRELRRTRSPEIQQHIENFEAMIKQSSGTKRATDTAERQDNNKRVKLEKRDTFIAVTPS